MSSPYKIQLGIQLDDSDIGTQVRGIKTSERIKIKVDLDGIDDIKRQIQQLGNVKINLGGIGASSSSGSSNEVNKLKKSYRELLTMSKQISNLEFKIGGLEIAGGNKNQIEVLKNQLKLLRSEYDRLVDSFNNGGGINSNIFDAGDFQKLNNAISESEAKIERLKAELADKIKLNIDTDIANNLSKVHSDFDKLSNKTGELKQKLDLLDSIKIDLDTAAANNDIDALIEANSRYEKVLKDVKTQIDINKRAENDAFDSDALKTGKENALLRLRNLFEDNSEAARKFGSEVDKLEKKINECGSTKGLSNINKEITNLSNRVKEANVQTQTLGSKLKDQFSKYSQYLSIASVFMYTEQALKDMFNQVVAIDSAMTELKKVTDETDASYNQFLTNAASRAKEIGTTIDGLIDSTADFARLGYSFKDSQGLAEVANIYAVVGDEVEGVEGATESLISTMAAFKDEMNGLSNTDFAMSITDKFNEIGNKFSITSGGIGEAMKRSASSLDAANNSIDESIALITAANTVVQDPDKVGNAFKTISMRIRGATTELQEAGLETEGMAESTAKMRQEIMALSGVDIMLNENTFKSTYQIMDELAYKWEDLSDIAQASIIELMAGKHQGNVFASLMSNFDTAREALEVSANSAGSAMQEHAKWSQSLEARLLKLKAAWQSLAQSFMSSDFLGNLLDGVTSLVNALDFLIDKFGTLPTLLGAFAGGRSLFNGKGLFTFDKDVKSIKLLGNGLTDLKGKYRQMQIAIDRYNSLSSKSASFQERYNKNLANSTSSMGKYLSGLNGAKASFGGYISSLVGATVKTIALEAATIALNAALTAGVSFLISAGVSAISKWIHAEEELAEKVSEVTSKYKEQHEELKKLQGDYDTNDESSMISRYGKLSKGVDNLGRNVSLTVQEYSEYQDIVDTIAGQIPSLVSGYDEQGNALLSCKGNVEALTEAYEKLIHAQNQGILTNTGDIEKNFANVVKDANGETLFGKFREWSTNSSLLEKFLINLNPVGGIVNAIDPIADLTSGNKMTTGTVKSLETLLNTDADKIGDIIASYDKQTMQEIETALKDAGVDVGFMGNNTADALEKTLKNDSAKIKGIIDNFYGNLEETVNTYKTSANALLSEAFDVSSPISGLNYGNISKELQTIAYQVVDSFDYDFASKLSESGQTLEQWTKEMLSQLNSLSDIDNKQIEAGFELQTKFNGGDISYGEYVGNLKNLESIIDGLDLKDEVKEQLKLSLNTEDILTDYNALVNDLKEIGFDDNSINSFLDGLSAEEYSAAMEIIPDLDAGVAIGEIQKLIDEKLATEFTFDITAQTEGLAALNTALSEARSATGLTAESITALKSRYEDLEGFNAASLFERTANGVRVNNEELARLEAQYENVNKLDIDKNLNNLIEKYQDLTEKIKTCTDEQEKKSLQLQADTYANKIEELQILSSQYDGLTSSFSKWQNAQSSANDGDNYDSLYDSLEGVQELYKKGLVGTDDFKTFAQLMSSKDLSTASIDENVSAYEKGIKLAKRYFTEGQSGCKNFLNDVNKLNSEWAHMNKDGLWEINFNAEEVAKELGTSVDAVLLIANKLRDYGFEVNLEDSSVDNLQTKIQKTEAKLKELGQTPYKANLDIEANTENLGKIDSEIEGIKAHIDKVNNDKSISVEAKTAQLDDAQAKLEALIQKKQEASQPAFMNLNTSQVNASLVDALGKIQEYQNAINEVNKLSELKEAGIAIDDSEIQTAKEKVDECAKAIQGLDGDVKVAIGLEEDGSIDSIKKSFEDGKVKIDANTDPAITKIEALAENVERIEDKDVTINVTVNGLEDVRELNKQINLATDIDGDIDKLSEYVKSAKTLSDLDDNIATYVSANVKGNVTKTPEYELNNLKVFSDSVEDLQDIGSFSSKVTADIDGNVINTPEYMINNLKVFSDSASNVEKIGDVTSKVTADVEGNVIDTKEYKINNLKTYAESAKDIYKIGNVESSVKATVNTGNDGDVVDTFEYKLNNLGEFATHASALQGLNDVDVSVNATVNTGNDGDVVDEFEYKLDNLGKFADNVTKLQGLSDVDVSVNAVVNTGNDGDVIDTFEYKLDNLGEFAKHASALQGLNDVDVNVTATVNTGESGDVIDEFEYKLDNLSEFAYHVKELQGLEDVDISVSARVNTGENGDVVDTFEHKINNLGEFATHVKELQGLQSVNISVNAKVNTGESGDVVDTFEHKLNNLGEFATHVRALQGLSDVDVSVNAVVNTGNDGDVIDTFEYKLDNLGEFAKHVEALQGLQDVDISVKAVVNTGNDGDVVDTFEYKLNNLSEFAKHVEALQGLENIDLSVSATVDGDVTETAEYKLNNLGEFKKHASALQDVKSKTVNITANIYGNVPEYSEGYINDLQTFAKGANELQNTASKTVSITANIYGNVPTYSEGYLNDLLIFADGAKLLQTVASKTVDITANINGNVVGGDGKSRISSLTEFKSLVDGMSSKTVAVNVTANVDSTDINSAITLLTNLNNSGVFKDYNATVQVGATIAKIDDAVVQNYQAPKKEGKVSYSVDPSSAVYTWTAPDKDGTVNYAAEVEALTYAQRNKTGTITYKAKVTGFPVVNGTANASGSAFANGTVGKAYKQGDWGVKQTTTALTGELGQELVVYKNKFWTVGDNGAEFATIPKGAIVFNHRQTEELFANGRVTSDGGRGKALVNGTAFAEGNAFITGSGEFYNDTTGKTYGKSSSSKSSSSSSSSSSSKEEKEEFEETIDWIETAIDRIERAIDQLDTKANSTYRSWSERNSALSSQISEVGDEIELQQKAYNEYMAAASGVGLDESYARKVRNGTIDIETITDEALKEKIDDYTEWYNKALACQDVILELTEAESELYTQRFENVQSQYDGIIQGYEHTEAMLNEYIAQAEEQGYIVSKKYYQSLVNNEKLNIAELKKQQEDLIDARDEAVASGAIKKGSEEWFEQCAAIDEVTQEIESGTTALLEYARAMEEIDWSIFDLIQERISAVSKEADFLIELMSNDKLFDDNGKLTSQGLATMGLHTQNYNSHMYAADTYGEEVAKLNKQIKSDPYDQELINRRNELLELQRESILAAEQEKDTIADLVSEGIEKELDSLSELIDEYNDALDSQKDLFDYQRDIEKQSKNIGSLRKQLSAYEGFDDEETKAKVQQLRLELSEAESDLEETEYDKYISDQRALLDELMLQYEQTLNSRLDNIDCLLEGIIESINATAGVDGVLTSALGSEGALAIAIGNNATSIKDTLASEAKNVGITLSSAMNSIWNTGEGNAKSVLTMYGEDFKSKSTTIITTLNGIKTDIAAMVDDIDKDAKKKTTANKTTTSAKKNPTTSSSSSSNKNNTTTNKTQTNKSSGDGKPKVGDKVKFVSGKYYYDSQGKNPLGSKYQGKEVYITSINTKSWATHPYHISTGSKLGSGDLGWLKLNQISGYATGKKNFLNGEIGWTQENGTEFIVRPSDGAILTPIAKGDSVLNATASKNIWNMANSPVDFIKNNLGLGNTNIPNGSNVNNNYTQNLESVVFNLPNVQNYNELLSQMQKDKNFEKLILSMSVDRLAGKSSLAKNKSIR